MKIKDKDIYHGAALAQIVGHNSFKALNCGSKKYGHYLINTDRNVFAKYSTKDPSWGFRFQVSELRALSKAMQEGMVYICLICGHTTICALTIEEAMSVIDLDSVVDQNIKVEIPLRGSCHVSGSKGKLGKTIAHNSFPDKVFS